MKNINVPLILLLVLSIVFIGCGPQEKSKTNAVIASKDGYELTEKHLDIYLEATKDYVPQEGDMQSKTMIREELKQAFLEEPERLLHDLNSMAANDAPIIEAPISEIKTVSHKPTTTPTRSIAIAEGHKVVRNVMGNDIGQIQFDSKLANTFRAFMANSLLSSKSNNGSSGYGSSSYSSSTTRIQFCANGTYIEANSGYVSIDVEGASAYSGDDTDYVPGYWEVASLPTGKPIIILYSTHPSMLEDFPNGLLPFPVGQYSENFVALPNGDGYSRIANQYCNY